MNRRLTPIDRRLKLGAARGLHAIKITGAKQGSNFLLENTLGKEQMKIYTALFESKTLNAVVVYELLYR